MARQLTTPPLKEFRPESRVCTRAIRDGEICGKVPVRHVIYHWEVGLDQPDDEQWDHGFCCKEHWMEYRRSWDCAFSHDLTSACGMPGSRCYPPDANTCLFHELPEAEPIRAIAEVAGAALGGEQ